MAESKTVRAQREYMTHVRSCPDCDGHGKRCELAQAMVTAIVAIARKEARNG